MDSTTYLMIQNPGVCPVEGFTVFGVSTARTDDSAGVIGKFGSGNKHAVNVCLRNNLAPTVFCGNLRLGFYVVQKEMKDGLTTKPYGEVHCKFSGKDEKDRSINRDKDLSFALEYGIHDWTEQAMGLREFVSNAIDRTIREFAAKHSEEESPAQIDWEAVVKSGELAVEVVNANQVRAKAGFTRIFVPYTDVVQKFYSELGKRFLHFSEPELLDKKILPKRNRNITPNSEVAVIYRKGVFVREVTGCKFPSVFDYNFNDELPIDESRNVDDWRVKYAATQAISRSEPENLAAVFRRLIDGEEIWEGTFDKDYLAADQIYHKPAQEQAKANWREGFELAAADAVLCGEKDVLTDTIQRKGFRIATIKSDGWLSAAEKNSVKTALSVLTKHEKAGQEVIEAMPAAIEAVNTVWDWLVDLKMTNGKEKPPVKGFRAIMQAESETMGYFDPNDGTVYINQTHSDAGVSRRLLRTALEELAHFVTGATDLSRDFQSFLIAVIVEKFVVGKELAE